MRHTGPIFISFALAACIANANPAFAMPVEQSPVLDVQIELTSGGFQRCWFVQTPWGPQRRCRGGGWGGYGGRGGYGGYRGYGGWGGGYGGWSGGYGYRRDGDWGDRD
jgi:hypothetical protein